jgi:hypothetical protein
MVWIVAVAQDAGLLGDAQHVQDQRHPPVAHDGRPREHRNVLQHLIQRLDDDFLGVVDLIDHQAELVLAGLQHHDVDDAGRARR